MELTPKQHLLMALNHYEIEIHKDAGERLELERDYEVEVESGFLFKLLWRGEVVAPFNDLDEMCQFIKMG